MFEFWLALDRAVFRAINLDWSNPFFDAVMPILSDDHRAKPFFIATFVALLVFGKSRGRWAALLVVPLIALSDQVSSNWLKDVFDRPRPCITLPDARLVGTGCSNRGSMPSSHAANMTAAALHFALFYRRRRAVVVALAALAVAIGYSRVYVGVHYPSDVLGGMVVGAACALTIHLAYVQARAWFERRRVSALRTTAGG